MAEPGMDTDVFDYESSARKSNPLDFSRLKAKPWKNVTHGRYKDIFNLNQLSPRDNQGSRPMRMSPDLDFKVDRRDKKEENVPLSVNQIEKKSTKIARDELKKVIMKQRLTLEKNTRLYKAISGRTGTESVPRAPIQSI